MHCLYAFCNEEKKECFLIMEFMNKDLSNYIKETCCPRRRVSFPLPVAVDIMLQIARGMEYLHSHKIYHGDLNPSNILVKARSSSPDGYLHIKIAGLGFSPAKNSKASTNQEATANLKATTNQAATANPCIWNAPEVLSEQEQQSADLTNSKYTEKADIYSFAMICFELLTGKIPFEDGHLQGDKMSRNIRAGERPLFPFPSPKYLTTLTKRCWQSDPLQRPSFSSICRMLRYIKRFLIINPDHSQPELPVPPIDYLDLEMSLKERSSESGSEGASVCEAESPTSIMISDDSLSASRSSSRSSSQASSDSSKKGSTKKVNEKANKQTGLNQKPKPVRPPQVSSCRSSLRIKYERQLQQAVMSSGRSRASGHASDSELAKIFKPMIFYQNAACFR